jgi:hypothetical protein
MKKVIGLLSVAALVATVGCAATPRVSSELPALATVGDFLPFEQDRIEYGDLLVALPVGWRLAEDTGGHLSLRSPDERGGIVTIQRVEMSRVVLPLERPAHCQTHYLTCTPIVSNYVTNFGVVQWRQTVYIDRGPEGVYRLDARWNDGPVGDGIPTLVGVIARSIVRMQ